MYISIPSNGAVYAEIKLPVSKSMYNRWLLINHLSDNPIMDKNIPASDDGRILAQCITNFYTQKIFDVQESGTALRFLTALCALTPGERILTGTQHLMSRPMSDLLSVLQFLDVPITETEENGRKFLHINGGHLQGGDIKIKANISSQYISALLLIAPLLPKGLKLQLLDRIASEPYIDMTIFMMKKAGVVVERTGSTISVAPQKYSSVSNHLEADWSAAAFWYEIMALSKHPKLMLRGLSAVSCQGDFIVKDIFEKLSVITSFSHGNAMLQKSSNSPSTIEVNFFNTPDLFPAMAVTCVALGVPFRFTGLHNLSSKESDRIEAMLTELKKIGAIFIFDSANHSLQFDGNRLIGSGEKVYFSTHNDHRVAMALAPLALLGMEVHLDNPECVSKSYPNFFNDLKSAGFYIHSEI